jgi:hypothetical protein
MENQVSETEQCPCFAYHHDPGANRLDEPHDPDFVRRALDLAARPPKDNPPST